MRRPRCPDAGARPPWRYYDGTDNHMVLVDLTIVGLTGRQATDLLGGVGITVNESLAPFEPRRSSPPTSCQGPCRKS